MNTIGSSNIEHKKRYEKTSSQPRKQNTMSTQQSLTTKEASVLQHSALFHGMQQDAMLHFMNCARPSKLRLLTGELLVSQGAAVRDVYVILSGHFIIEKLDASGNALFLGRLEAGDIFGHESAFSDTPESPVEVRAGEKSVVLRFSAQTLYQTCSVSCNTHHSVTRNMMRFMAREAQERRDHIHVLSAGSLKGKIAQVLLAAEKVAGEPFTLDMNREAFARFLGVTRPSLSRALGELRDDGILRFQRSEFTILNHTSLKAYE